MKHTTRIFAALAAAFWGTALPSPAGAEGFVADLVEAREAEANRDLAGLAEALLARDAAAAKPYFAFPVKRPWPLPDVGEEDFEAYFPTLFDEGFFKGFEAAAREQGTALWKGIGWRGFYSWCLGMNSEDGRTVTAVHYESAAERERREAMEREEIASLAPALREGGFRPRFSFATDDGEWRGRLDATADGGERIALWRRGHPLGGSPDVVCAAAGKYEGSAGNGRHEPLDPEAAAPFVKLWENYAGPADEPPLELVLLAGEDEATLPADRVHWTELLAGDAAGETPVAVEEEDPAGSGREGAGNGGAADLVRRALEDYGMHYRETTQNGTAVFDYALRLREGSPLFPCDILVEEGAPRVVARAMLREKVPAARRRAVAECLLDLNRQRAAGSYWLDWASRRLFCEFSVPAEYLPDDSSESEMLLFVAAPTLYLDENRDRILAAAGLAPWGEAGDAGAGAEPAAEGADGGAGDSGVAPLADASAGEEASSFDPGKAPWAAEMALNALRRCGATPFIDCGTPDPCAFQFRVNPTGKSVFASSTAVLKVSENWVFLSLSPEMRVDGRARGAVAEWAMRVTGVGKPAAFTWTTDYDDARRLAVQTSCPAGVFAGDPDRWLARLLQDADAAFAAHSRSLAAVLSGAVASARALAATGEGPRRPEGMFFTDAR